MSPAPIDIAQDGNLFPREDLLEAVAESDWRDRSVPTLAWVLAALGLASLAAGTPIARFVVMGPVEFAATSSSFLTAPAHALIAAVGRTGIGIEATFFLASALAFGACLPAMGLVLRAAGFGGRLAFTAALVTVVSPLLALHGRLPSDAPFVALAGALVVAAIAAPRDAGPDGRRGYAVRIAFAFAVLLALAGHSVASAFAAGEIGAIHGRWTDAVLVGGVAWFAVPFGWIREAEELPPPAWLVVWIAVAVMLATTVNDALGLLALPTLALLVANVLARRARPDGALRWALGLCGIQIAMTIGASANAPENTTSFAATSRGETLRGDRVRVREGSSVTAYLLRRRLGLGVEEYVPGTLDGMGSVGDRELFLDEPLAPWAEWILDSQSGEVTAVE